VIQVNSHNRVVSDRRSVASGQKTYLIFDI
jgi:hypothetical protein